MGVFRSYEALLKSAEAKPPRCVHRPDTPTGLSQSMVVSPQCRFPFARQNHCSPWAIEEAHSRRFVHRDLMNS